MNNNTVTPAERVSQIKEYFFSRKLKEINEFKEQGHDIISLGIGGPDRPPHKSVIEKLNNEALQPDSHSYQPYIGIKELRDEFAEWYKRHYKVNLNPDEEILPLIGSKEGILHISMTFLNPGDGVLVPDPGYPTYTSVSRMVGANIFTYNLTPENGWYPDFGELEKMPLDRIKLMWLNYPNMPTGTPASLDVFKRIIDFGKRHNIVIVHDNPYSFILNNNPISILSIDGARDIAIELNSLSKSHNMAGWRIGMLATNPSFLSWIIKVKSNIDSGQFRPVMRAAAEALRLDKDWYASLNEAYASRRLIAEKIAAALNCSFDKNQTGLFLWARIPDDCSDCVSFTDNILYEKGIFITPGVIFGKNGKDFIRISLCAPEHRMKEALSRITTKK